MAEDAATPGRESGRWERKRRNPDGRGRGGTKNTKDGNNDEEARQTTRGGKRVSSDLP